MDPPMGAIPNRARKRKVTAKLSFRSTSTGNSSLTYQPRANFTHLIALPPTAQKGEGDECWPVLTVNATEKTGLITATTTGENNEAESVHRRKPLAKSCDAATSKLVLHPSSTGAYDQVIIVEKPGRRALTESDVPEMVRHVRELLQHQGRSQEHELVEAVCLLPAELVLQIQGRMTAFLNRRPEFVVVNEDCHCFVYDEDVDGEVQDGSTSQIRHETITSTSSNSCNDHQKAAVCGVRVHVACSPISSGRPVNEPTIQVEHREREQHVLKNAVIQVTSLRRSQVVRKAKQRFDAKTKREECHASGITGAEWTKEIYDSDVVQLQKQETLRSNPYKVHQQLAKVDARLHAIQTRFTAECSGTEEKPQQEKPVAYQPNSDSRFHCYGHGEVAKGIQHLVYSQRISPERHQPALHPSRLLMLTDDLPSHQNYHHPWRSPPNRPVVGSRQLLRPRTSRLCCPPRKKRRRGAKMKDKLSRIARMAKNRRPDNAENDVRTKIVYLRKSRGGLSGMTYNDIVARVLVQFDALAKDAE
ncbi:hypothetical protein HPB50_023294 [Hyalomma asiaticum]|uniref:Uncharacterized protein n=1 Tax=Hyalomma asiaticum TaxID=266040 RepID=A0ACB7SVZ9_HYAAI|nr:hypothetical protein HPB50_023294 [Hyalomma asiaticum]